MEEETRPNQILSAYDALIDAHLDDLVNNRADRMLEIEEFAGQLFIHPVHLSNTIKEVTGESACGIYQVKILDKAKELLADERLSIKQIALLLTYEPSQFTKWFKWLTGQTPKAFRQILKP